jgi:tetratricopeptide (TPR) repeat protein
LLVYEPVKRAAARRAAASTSTRARARADARLLARAREERDRLTSAEADELIEAAERAQTPTDAEAFVRAIPPWVARGPHVPRLRALATRGVALPPPLDAELSVLEGDLERATARLAEPPSSNGHATAERALTAAYVARRRGDHAQARAWLAEVVAHGPSALRARALNELAAVHYLDGRVRPSTSALEDASALASREELTPLRAAIASNLANARADLGDLDAARRSAEEAFALALDERARAITLAGIARLALERGDANEAERTIAQVRRTGVPAEDVGLRSFVRRLDAWVAHHRGDVGGASDAFDEAAAIAHAAGETHLFGRARVEHALCMSAHDPARAWALSHDVPGTLAAAVSKAARIALARAAESEDDANDAEERDAEERDPREDDSSTVDERCVRLLSLLDPRIPQDAAWTALRLARRAAMTRAAAAMLRAHAPARLAFVRLGARDVLVGDLHVDLRRAPVLWRVLTSVADAGEAGIDPDALLAHGWPDERLVRRRAIHRVHGRVRELRALGVPIELVEGRYRLALPLTPR